MSWSRLRSVIRRRIGYTSGHVPFDRREPVAVLVPTDLIVGAPRPTGRFGGCLYGRCATMCVMERVGVREIRRNLSVFLRRVREGETFTVTDHGAPVALLTPLPSLATDPLADLVAAGRVAPANGRGGPLPQPAAAPVGTSATAALLAERAVERR